MSKIKYDHSEFGIDANDIIKQAKENADRACDVLGYIEERKEEISQESELFKELSIIEKMLRGEYDE